MLTITVPESRRFNQITQEFVYIKETTLRLEHSLVSISKWEAIYCKPFLSKEKMSTAETLEYIKCMTITQNVPDEVYYGLTAENMMAIQKYIDSPMTATYVTDPPSSKGKSETMTSEVIYYYMTAFQIPVEFEKWHLNRLLMLIKVCNAKNQPPKKMSRSEILRQQDALNEMRKAKLGTTG